MKDSWFRIEFINKVSEDYYNDICSLSRSSTRIYPQKPYRGLCNLSESAYIMSAIHKYRCSFREAFDRFYRLLQDRNYEEIRQTCHWGYENSIDMLEYEAKNKTKLPTRKV